MLNEYQNVTICDFLGAYLRREPSDIPPSGALLSLNSEYGPGQVSTRKGFSQVWNPAERITSMYNWVKTGDLISPTGSYLLYFNPTSQKARYVPNLAAPSPADLFTITGSGAYGITYAPVGAAMFVVAAHKPDGSGATQARVCQTYVFSVVVDKAFAGPMTNKPTLTEPAAGTVTAGTHRVGYIVESRSGFTGQISPMDDGTGSFDVSSTIKSSGSKNIHFVLNPTWPSDAGLVWPVMTPTTNLDRYFIVPGLSAAPSGSISFDIDITDDDLIATGTEVTDNLSLFTQDTSGDGPFNPSFTCEFGFRTIYLVTNGTMSQGYASEPSKPQHLTADQHIFNLPGFRQMVCAQPIGRNLYIFGPHWTYVTDDSGSLPVEWPSPSLVDGARGTMSPRGVAFNTSNGIMWVADQGGLFAFQGGAYPQKPVSYEVDPDWQRINWAYGYMVEVTDDPTKQRVYVKAPLDGAVVPTHILVFDYSNGIEFSQVKYSLWNISGYTPGAMSIVQNPVNKRLELWIANGAVTAGGKVLRQMNDGDTNPYRDDSLGIDWQHEVGLFPGSQSAEMGTVYLHPGIQLRARGSGSLAITSYSIDRIRSLPLTATVLSALPGKEYTKRLDLRSEGCSHRFAMNTPDSYCVLSALRHFYAPWIGFR